MKHLALALAAFLTAAIPVWAQSEKERSEQVQFEIIKHIRDGERFFNAHRYDKAIEEFESAECHIQHIPYEVKPIVELLPKVKDYVVKAKNARILEERAAAEEAKRMAENEAASHEVATQREVVRKIAQLLELA